MTAKKNPASQNVKMFPEGEEADAHTTPATSGVAPTAKTKSVGGFTFAKKKMVTVPVLKLMPDAPAYVRFEAKMEISKQIKTEKTKDMEPATIVHCLDLVADSECILIVGTMLKSVIEESYPNDSYVGLSFEIINHGKRGDKKYNSYSVVEVSVED